MHENNMKIMNGSFKHKDEHCYTRYRWNQVTQLFDQRPIIDYMLTSDKRLLKNVKVLPGDSLNSDHRLLIGNLNIKKIKHKQIQKRKVIKVETLKDNETKDKYRVALHEKIDHREDKDWQALK